MNLYHKVDNFVPIFSVPDYKAEWTIKGTVGRSFMKSGTRHSQSSILNGKSKDLVFISDFIYLSFF